jgi:penicillin amidase
MRKMFAAAVLFTASTGAIGASPAIDSLRPLTVDGLSEPVEVLRDRWGVNHIYAKNEPDLFFVQGYTAARDRLFQFELWATEDATSLRPPTDRRSQAPGRQ